MNLKEFFTLILPDEGYRFIAKKTTRTTHHAFTNNSEAATAALKFDKTLDPNEHNHAVFFACSTYKQASYKTAKGISYRGAENVHQTKSIWRDLDVGKPTADSYDSLEAAVEAALGFAERAGLPEPFLVSSGSGCHAYWILTEALSPEQWKPLAKKLVMLCEQYGFKGDTHRDDEITSLLRPIGTFNNKQDTPTKVRCINVGTDPIDPSELNELLDAKLIKKNGKHHPKVDSLGVAPSYLQSASDETDALAKLIAYPKSDAIQMAAKCAQLAHFRDTGGQTYNAWFLGLGSCRPCIDGEKIAHEWAAKYDTYDEAETEKKLAEWEGIGPATCEAYNNLEGRCDKCKHIGKIKAPIQLGVTEAAIDAIVVASEAEDEEDPDAVFILPKGYCRHEGKVCVKFKQDDVWEIKPVSNVLYTLTERYQQEDGTMAYRGLMRVRKEDNGKYSKREFSIPASAVGKGGKELLGCLAENEIMTAGNAKQIENFTMQLANQLRERRSATKSYTSFGWQSNCNEFLLGDTLYTETKSHKVVLTDKDMCKILPAFDRNADASLTEWTKAVDEMYNHQNHEQFWFAIYSAFASPLNQLLGLNIGLPINLSGQTGKGKSATGWVGLTAWGDDNIIGTVWHGTTENALFNKLACLGCIPTVVDEITNIKPDEASRLAYALSNGRDKERLNSAAERSAVATFSNTVILTANSSMHETIAASKQDASAEISRLIELNWVDVETLTRAKFEALLAICRYNRGAASIAYIKWLLTGNNRKVATKLFNQIREDLEHKLSIDKEFRFWSLGWSGVLTAGYITTHLMGLFSYSWEDVHEYTMALARNHLDKISGHTQDGWDVFHQIITHYVTQTIVTDTMKDARQQQPDQVTLTQKPVARLIRSSGDYYISMPAIREWCSINHASMAEIKKEVTRRGVLKGQERIFLGRGTTKETGQMNCFHIDWNKLQALEPALAKVIHLHPT